MGGPPLTSQTQQRLDSVFPPALRAEAHRLLVEECGNNLPFCERSTSFAMERLRFAAMKESGGTLEGLRSAIDLAKRDWRDLLMSAGFGISISAHLLWEPSGDAG